MIMFIISYKPAVKV